MRGTHGGCPVTHLGVAVAGRDALEDFPSLPVKSSALDPRVIANNSNNNNSNNNNNNNNNKLNLYCYPNYSRGFTSYHTQI